MKLIRRINFQWAARFILGISVLVIFYHTLIMTGVVPYAYAWGGRLESWGQMIQFESVSIFINILLMFFVAMKGNFFRFKLPNIIINSTLWIFTIILLLNTIGNLFALNSLETILFTPVTAVLSVLLLRLSIE